MSLVPVAIPSVARLIWIGPTLWPIAWLAAAAARDRGGFDRVVLHYTDTELLDDPSVQALARDFAVELVHEAPEPLLRGVADELPRATGLWPLYQRLGPAASRSNLIRLGVLLRDGGVYLDTDAIVLRNMKPLLAQQGFAGLERICLPAVVRDSRSPIRWARAGALLALRDVMSRGATGLKLWPKVEGAFDLAVNNAVIGAVPHHPLIAEALIQAAEMDDRRAGQMYQLGPKLLESVTGNRSVGPFKLYPPAAFYPLPPEMSWHLFRNAPPPPIGDAFGTDTWVVHLYDSVLRRRKGQSLDVDWLKAHRGRTLVTALVDPWLDALFAVGGVG
ncbi:MAG: hypothetical protein KC502_14410 [Myxococcales bacterium]|nr:hypothetical protein [Myxococcales bacterium]